MSGAYVAKPDPPYEPPSYPDIPFGWNAVWPWPSRANPPGYPTPEPGEYGLSLSTSRDAVAPGESIDATGLLTDSSGNPAGLPVGDWEQSWSASIDGTPIAIKQSGAGGYSDFLTYGYEPISRFYGATDTIEFDITEDDRGKTITLTAYTTIEGEEYTDSGLIEIPENQRYCIVTISTGSAYGPTSIECDPGTGTITASAGKDESAEETVTISESVLPSLVDSIVSATFSFTNEDGGPTDELTAAWVATVYDESDSVVSEVSGEFSELAGSIGNSDTVTEDIYEYYENFLGDIAVATV